MNTETLATMMNDKHFFDLKKMQHKYSAKSVAEMVEALRVISYEPIALKDFNNKPCVYLPSKSHIPSRVIKTLLTSGGSEELFGRKAMEEEIEATLRIENIQSNRDSVRKILRGFAPESEEENHIYGLKKGLDFISDKANTITEENLHRLYMLCVGNYLIGDERIPEGGFYRNAAVYIIGDKPYHEGLNPKLLPLYMAELIRYANQKDDMPELVKACILHFYLAYLHPYFDGNGRTARLLQLWYLVQQGFSSTLFYAFSNHINNSKDKYYRSFITIEDNYKISNLLDVTPFILYFKEQVYKNIEAVSREGLTSEIFTRAMKDGNITEKEMALWNFVISVYGEGAFSTKQLEKDFGDAAYATIRGFVLKFEGLSLLTSQKYGNRVKYKVTRQSA